MRPSTKVFLAAVVALVLTALVPFGKLLGVVIALGLMYWGYRLHKLGR